MKQLMQKYEILVLRNRIDNVSKVAKLAGVSRNTVRKYWNEYQENLRLLLETDPNVDTRTIIEEIVSDPKYDTSSRKPIKYTNDIDELLDNILNDEKIKSKQLGHNHKQRLTYSQIHELITKQGYDIGITTISEKIKEKRNYRKEAFIKQQYDYCDRFEYDFGEVVLIISGKRTKAHIAVLSAPASGFRWAYLYRNQKMDVFLDSHVRFFEMIGGCFKEGVYDNMRNVVSKFIGRNEKELNQELIRLALYYGFDINVTNCFSGNEKGTVESAVKWIRNKTFAYRYEFKTFDDACDYLENMLIDINSDSNIEEEKKYLTPYRPKYETADVIVCHVNKYSFIQVDTNIYSVPDDLVDKQVVVKKYPKVLQVFYREKLQCEHERCFERKKTCIDIRHYLDTFRRKPGALRNSLALKCEPELKFLFDTYFKANPREFIDILFVNRDKDIEEVINIIKNRNTAIENTNWIEDKVDEQFNSLSALFIGGTNYVN